ncbi:MAG TPA: hypothetical protein VKS60_24960 [Stellaceae bacterium]|nr:hypothetical protein [Stellaceae bacterium]
MIVDQIEAHFRGVPRGAAGNVPLGTLRVLERLIAGREIRCSVETTAGASTILIGAVSARHIAFVEDDRPAPTSAVRCVETCPIARPEGIEFVHGMLGLVLPRHAFDTPIDLLLLGGAHRLPFPVGAFGLLARHLPDGTGLLVLDDVQLPHIRRLYDHLLEAEAFALAGLAGGTAFFRRTGAPLGDPLPPGWGERPLPVEAVRPDDAASMLSLAAEAAERGTDAFEQAQLAANHGIAALAAGAFDTAEAAFRTALARQADNSEAYDGLASLAVARDKPAEALAFRRWASLLDPNRASIRLELVRDLLRLRRFEAAETELHGVLRLSPDHHEALDFLEELYTVIGRPADAAVCRERARADGPEGPLPVYVAGTVLDFTAAGNALRYVGRGWQAAEGWGRWTRAREATVDFVLDAKDGEPGDGVLATIELQLAASHAGPSFRPALDFAVNGVEVATRGLPSIAESSGQVMAAVTFDSRVFRAGRANAIALTFHTPVVPALVMESTDPRVLGVVVSTLKLSFRKLGPAPAPAAA